MRAEKILALMNVFAEKNKGTLEQIFAVSMAADFYKNFGQCELAAEYYAKYEALNEKHMSELIAMQLQLHKTMRSTETEIRRLNKKMRKSEELVSHEPMTGLLNRYAFEMDLKELPDIPVWYADYEPLPQTPYAFTMWQYSNEGKISGISGACDLDIQLIPE